MKKITLNFDDHETGKLFLSWLSNSGEQDFFDSLQMHHSNGATSADFDYHTANKNKFGPVVNVKTYFDKEDSDE